MLNWFTAAAAVALQMLRSDINLQFVNLAKEHENSLKHVADKRLRQQQQRQAITTRQQAIRRGYNSVGSTQTHTKLTQSTIY